MSARALLLLACTLGAAGCLNAGVEGSRFFCGDDSACPQGYTCCGDGYCATSCGGDGGSGDCSETDTPCCSPEGAIYSGCWPDTGSTLSWESTPSAETHAQADARFRCDGLVLGGHDDWRLPSVDELRSLIRGCPVTEPGGACPASDPSCLSSTADTCNTDACLGCSSAQNGGPGGGGCYWDAALAGSCAEATWSRSVDTVVPASYSWVVFFDRAMVTAMENATELSARCVRGTFRQ